MTLGVDKLCPRCHVDTTDPTYLQIIEADRQSWVYRAEYTTLLERWRTLDKQREAWVSQLIQAGPAAGSATVPPVWASSDPWLPPGTSTGPTPASEGATVAAVTPTPTPVKKARAVRRTPRRLSAPALLGIAGASMLITAAIVFVAVTWETFFPIAQGLLVLTIAGAVAWLSLWLSRHSLGTSGGAVGVVAMAFTGVATIAFDRADGSLGSFALPVALLVISASGYGLSRLEVRWVGPMAALSLVASAGSLALAFQRGPGLHYSAASTVVAFAAGTAAGLTTRWWSAPLDRWMVRIGSTAVVTVGALPACLELSRETTPNPQVVAAALLPVVGLAVAGRWVPRVTVGPALLVATVVAVATVAGPTDHGSASVAAGIGCAALALAAIALAPHQWRIPALVGAAPMALGALVLVVFEIWRLVTWAASFELGGAPPIIDRWAAVSAILLATAAAVLRLWRDRPEWLRYVEMPGAILATVGFSGLAFPVTRSLPQPHVWGYPLVLEIAGLATALAGLAWTNKRARLWSGIGGVTVGTVGALNAAWPLATRTVPLAVGLALGLVPVIVLIACARRWPPIVLPSAALLLPIMAAAAVAYDDQWGRASAVGTAVIAAVLWAGRWVPSRWHVPIVGGLAVPLAGAVVASLFWALPPLTRAFVDGPMAAGRIDVWGGLTSAFAGAALAALTRWRLPRGMASTLGIAGAVVTLLAGAATTFAIASTWGDAATVAVALAGSMAALVALSFALLWSTTPAQLASGIGATFLVTISGFHGIVAFASADTPLAIGLVALGVPIALLVAFGRRWPAVTLGPASLLATAAAASAAFRADLADEAPFACAIAVAAGIAWATTTLPSRFRLPVVAGLLPATAAALALSFFAFFLGLLAMPDPASAPPGYSLPWLTATMVGGVGLAAAFRHGWGREQDARITGLVGAVFATAAASIGTAWFIYGPHSSPGLTTLVATGAGAAVAATALIWIPKDIRMGVGIVGVIWATYEALPTLVKVGSGDYPVVAGLGAVGVTVAVLVVASIRWPTITLGSVSLLVSWGAIAGAARCDNAIAAIAVAAAASVALVAWAAVLLDARRGPALLRGVATAGVVVVAALVFGFASSLARLVDVIGHGRAEPISVELGLVAVLGAATVLAWSPARLNVGWMMLPFSFAASGALPHPWASVSMLALGLGAVALATRRSSSAWGIAPGAIMGFFACGVGWAAGIDAGLAAAATISLVGAAYLISIVEAESRPPALMGANIFAGIAAGFGVSAMGGPAPMCYGAAMAGLFAVSLVIRARGLDPAMILTSAVAGTATVLIASWAPSMTASGVALLIAGAGWLGHAVLGSRESRWVSSVVLSLGTALILAGANINVIEAYTAVPAGTALAIGLWWLAEDSEVRTLRALGPGLSLALIPSYFALALDPNSLPRTLALTAATVILAGAGVSLRWFAPILATAVTAVTVSLTQVTVGSDIVPRWVSFAIVGSILIAIAATYEKLQKLR